MSQLGNTHDPRSHHGPTPYETTSTCPSCGAEIHFSIGTSRSGVCRYCGAIVARRGQELDLVGKVAEVIPTGTRIAIGARGTYFSVALTVVGRIQLRWGQGVWDEWFVALDNGRTGWLAEAAGHYYLTFPMSSIPVPPRHEVKPGERVDFPGAGLFTVTDVKQAEIVSCEGELPDVVSLGDQPMTADLEGSHGAFATIDYGSEGDPVAIFAGRMVTPDELGLRLPSGSAAHGPTTEGMTLQCTNCGAPVTRRVPEMSVRIACASCGALLDTSHGAFRVIEVLDQYRAEPPIPLGTTGTLFEKSYVVVGFMVRGTTIEGSHYTWDELLLYEPKTTGFAWLVSSDGHWSIAESVSVAEVTDEGTVARFEGRKYRLFSQSTATVEHVLGEFYWQVQAGEEAMVQDFIAPPHGLSAERTKNEVNWSRAKYLESSVVAKAFGVPTLGSGYKVGIGMLRPWPLEESKVSFLGWTVGSLGAVILLAIAFMAIPSRTVITHVFTPNEQQSVDPTAEDAPQGGKVLSFLSEPIELSGQKALSARVTSNVDNSWSFVEGGLIQEASGETAVFGLETAYYHGYEDGESWTEGSQSASETISALPAGRYVVRADLEWDPALASPPKVTLEIEEGTSSPWQFLAALFSVLLFPVLALQHRRRFEKSRWEDSNVGET